MNTCHLPVIVTPYESGSALNKVRYATGTDSASSGFDDYVWVQIELIVPAGLSEGHYSGVLSFDFMALTE
jgi:hypothetical protein